MNTGAFGENFPYSNFHDLNMDWVIRIAKDFLDQYTHIQEIIANGEESLQNLTTSGLEQLQEKADALKALLQQWYDTHSADIANQLAEALEDLNEWYTEHQNYLDQTLQDNITAFNTAADQKAAQTIASIPADYTALSNKVNTIDDTTIQIDRLLNYKNENTNYGNLTNMNSAEPNTYYCINMSYDIRTKIANLPADAPLDGTNWYALTLNYYNGVSSSDSLIQFFFRNDLSVIFRRQKEGGTWYSWRVVSDSTLTVKTNKNINYKNQSTVFGSLTDLNTAEANTYYCISMGYDIRDKVANLPADAPLDGLNWYILTLNYYNGVSSADSVIQFFFKNDLSIIFRRQKEGSTWYSWKNIAEQFNKTEKNLNYRNGTTVFGSLTNANNANPNTFYALTMAYDIKTSIANLPADAPMDGQTWYLYTMNFYNQLTSTNSIVQYMFRNDLAFVYRRQFESNTWYNWRRVLSASTRTQITVDINGNGDYTSFTSALAYAYNRGNTDIYVKNGIYDITQEINLETAGAGPLIGNGTRLFFESNAIIQCYYNGSSTSVKSNFSPLNAGDDSGFEIHNMKIRCRNVRYCVHDEHSGASTPYTNKYINCSMYLDNSSSNWDSPACIGGGLGKYGIIEIDGGYYEGTVHQGDSSYGEISYHNGAVADAISEIYVRNVYCKNNTIRFGYYGQSTKITKCFISGCSVAVEPLLRPETPAEVNVNMELIKWNNNVRN